MRLPAIGADRADGDLGGVAAVDVEAHLGAPQVVEIDVPRAEQAHFLADGEEDGERRMGETTAQQSLDQRHQRRARGSVVAAEGGVAGAGDAMAAPDDLGAATERHGVEVSHEQSTRSAVAAAVGRAGAR